MQIRRTTAALVAAAAVLTGGALTGCSGPISKTGTPADNATNTAGASPGSDAQGNLPNLSNRQPSTEAGRAGGNGVGVP